MSNIKTLAIQMAMIPFAIGLLSEKGYAGDTWSWVIYSALTIYGFGLIWLMAEST